MSVFQSIGVDSAGTATIGRAGQPLDFLLLDDDPVLLRLIQRQLASSALNYACVRDHRQATTLIHQCQPATVLVDYRMPEMDGLAYIDFLYGQTSVNRLSDNQSSITKLSAKTSATTIGKLRARFPSVQHSHFYITSSVPLPDAAQIKALQIGARVLIKDRLMEPGYIEKICAHCAMAA